MSWSLFGTKCKACGKRTRSVVVAQAEASVGLQTMVCQACSARLKSEAVARAEAQQHEVEQAKSREEAKRRENQALH